MADNDFLKKHNPDYIVYSLIPWIVVMGGALIYQAISKLFH